MKFIRTREGRIIDLERYENKTTPILKAKGFITLIDKLKMCDIEIYEKDIIKESDTIEGLCDEFVVCQEGKQPISTSIDEKEMFMKMKAVIMLSAIAKMDCWMKLAIWTDKGLAYVAKMNEKGEFELL